MGRGLTIGVLPCERYSQIFGRCRFLGGGGMFFGVPVSCARALYKGVVFVEINIGLHRRIFEECFDRYCWGL